MTSSIAWRIFDKRAEHHLYSNVAPACSPHATGAFQTNCDLTCQTITELLSEWWKRAASWVPSKRLMPW